LETKKTFVLKLANNIIPGNSMQCWGKIVSNKIEQCRAVRTWS